MSLNLLVRDVAQALLPAAPRLDSDILMPWNEDEPDREPSRRNIIGRGQYLVLVSIHWLTPIPRQLQIVGRHQESRDSSRRSRGPSTKRVEMSLDPAGMSASAD